MVSVNTYMVFVVHRVSVIILLIQMEKLRHYPVLQATWPVLKVTGLKPEEGALVAMLIIAKRFSCLF